MFDDSKSGVDRCGHCLMIVNQVWTGVDRCGHCLMIVNQVWTGVDNV
jgi:hypothetical protein